MPSLPLRSGKRLSVWKTIFIIIDLLLVCLVGWYWYNPVHPLLKYGFQIYEPTRLPAGIHISEKRISILDADGNFMGIQAEMNFRTVDWVYGIDESRIDTSTSPSSSIVTTKMNNYDPKSVSFTCEQQISPKGQSYRLCHSVDYGKISVFETNFIKGDTYIGTKFPTTTNKVIPISQINAYVDSFVKARATGFKIESGGV